jgi:excisionase family DNA binding protein
MALPKFFTIAEVAEIARAPRNTVRYWVYSGRLRSRRVGRRRLVTEDELRIFMQVDAREGVR